MTYDNGPICPHCGGQTHYYDKAKRIVKGKYGEVRKIYVYRYRCLQCGEIHRIIPDTLIPFKHYEREIIQGVIEGTITPDGWLMLYIYMKVSKSSSMIVPESAKMDHTQRQASGRLCGL